MCLATERTYHTLLRHMAASTRQFVTSMKGMAKRMTSIRPGKKLCLLSVFALIFFYPKITFCQPLSPLIWRAEYRATGRDQELICNGIFCGWLLIHIGTEHIWLFWIDMYHRP